MPDTTDRPLVVSIEGNLLSGVSSIIKGLTDRHQSTYRLQAVYEPLKNIIHSSIGDIRWAQHKESQEGISACVLEMSAFFRQRAQLDIKHNTDVIVLDRSLSSLRHVFHLTSDMMMQRNTVDAVALHELHKSMEKFVPKPDMIVYVHAPIQDLRSRIRMSRDHHISYQTLVDIDNLYNDFLAVYEADENSPTVVRVENANSKLASATYRTHAAISELFLFSKISEYSTTFSTCISYGDDHPTVLLDN